MTEREQLAAELALGLLAGEDLLTARGLAASDPAFAAQVADWEGKLAPLLDEILPAEPAPDLWRRIEATLDAEPAGGTAVAELQRRVRRWQWTAGLSAAAALVIAVLAGPELLRQSAPPPVAAPLVASFTLPATEARLGLTYVPERGDLLVSAVGLSADGIHDHELWLVPPEGKTISLGVVVPGKARRVHLPDDLAARLADGATLALTREPLGGSAGRPAGPIVATTKLSAT